MYPRRAIAQLATNCASLLHYELCNANKTGWKESGRERENSNCLNAMLAGSFWWCCGFSCEIHIFSSSSVFERVCAFNSAVAWCAFVSMRFSYSATCKFSVNCIWLYYENTRMHEKTYKESVRKQLWHNWDQ